MRWRGGKEEAAKVQVFEKTKETKWEKYKQKNGSWRRQRRLLKREREGDISVTVAIILLKGVLNNKK